MLKAIELYKNLQNGLFFLFTKGGVDMNVNNNKNYNVNDTWLLLTK